MVPLFNYLRSLVNIKLLNDFSFGLLPLIFYFYFFINFTNAEMAAILFIWYCMSKLLMETAERTMQIDEIERKSSK